jgi:SAM-dependent methyltransferase
MSAAFADHFSGVADAYAASRPTYPDALFRWLAQRVGASAHAWDAGCGSGQASVGLIAHIAHVTATDPSARQIAAATPHSRITYAVTGERCPQLADASIDLITVAQALHWFDRDAFYAEVARVLRPGGTLAVWTYGLTRVSPDVDTLVDDLYTRVLSAYWPAERRHVDDQYAHIGFPYDRAAVPAFAMEVRWTAAQFVEYLGTWSAVAAYRATHDRDPLATMAESLHAAWGGDARLVAWPLTVVVGSPAPPR